jgi:hypothetical protein
MPIEGESPLPKEPQVQESLDDELEFEQRHPLIWKESEDCGSDNHGILETCIQEIEADPGKSDTPKSSVEESKTRPKPRFPRLGLGL